MPVELSSKPQFTCDLCGRRVQRVTKHHLIPRTRHKNKKNKKDFERKEVKQRIMWTCLPCHHHLHAVLTEKELEREYNTRQLLLEHPEIHKFISWIKNKPDGTVVPAKKSNARSQARSRPK